MKYSSVRESLHEEREPAGSHNHTHTHTWNFLLFWGDSLAQAKGRWTTDLAICFPFVRESHCICVRVCLCVCAVGIKWVIFFFFFFTAPTKLLLIWFHLFARWFCRSLYFFFSSLLLARVLSDGCKPLPCWSLLPHPLLPIAPTTALLSPLSAAKQASIKFFVSLS